MRPKDHYENYRQALLAGGAAKNEVDEEIDRMKAEDVKIAAGVCPRCGFEKITRMQDPRQEGPTEIAGKWFNYRCGNPRACGWFADKCEPVGEN